MTRLFIASMINSRYSDDIKPSNKRLVRYLSKQGWLTLDKKLNDKFGVYIRDNNM